MFNTESVYYLKVLLIKNLSITYCRKSYKRDSQEEIKKIIVSEQPNKILPQSLKSEKALNPGFAMTKLELPNLHTFGHELHCTIIS